MSIFRGEEHMIEVANEVMIEKLWRRKENEVIGKKLLDVFPELKEQKYPELLQEVYRSGKVHNEKESLAYVDANDGMKKFWFDYEYHPLKEHDGTVSGIMITVNDVTGQVEARMRVQENEERLKMATQLTKLGTWEFNPISGELNWSDECKEIYGLPGGVQVDFSMFSEHIYPADKTYVEEAIQSAMKTSGDGNYDITYRILRFSDKAVRWIRAKGKVYFNVNQQADRFIGTVVDITDQKLSQEILEESEQRSRLAIEAARMGTFDWDLVTNEFISSQRLNDIFGFEGRPNISHKNLIDAFHPEDKPRRDEAVKKAGIEGSLSYEVRIIWPDQSIHWVKVYGKVLYNGQQPLRMYGTAIDITDEKRNTAALEENTARLNIAIEGAELGTWELNLKTLEPYYSERYLEMMGYKKDTLPNHEDLLSKIHPEDMPRRNEAIKKALETGSLDIEMRVLPDNRNIRWVKGRGKIFYDEHGVPEKMLGTLMDITEAKKILSVLQESEERFRNVANSAPVFIWMAGTDKLRNFFNLAWLNFTGRTMEEERGYGWTEGVHPDDFNQCVNYYIDSFDKKEEFYIQYRLKRHDGEYRWMSARAVPRFSISGIFEGYIGACMDIHEQVVYQRKLKDDEERLNIIINASELGTWELNLKTKDAQYSDRCLQILGYSNRSKATRQKILMQFHPEDLLIRARAFKRALITGVLFFEARVNWSDHSTHWIESKGKVFYDDNNKPSHIIGTLRDITEQKYYQQELEDREKKFRLLADSMPELVWTGDVEGNLNYFNQSVYDYTGLTPEQIRKEGWLQIVHPADREENIRLWLDAVSTGKDFLFEHRFRMHNGEYNWQLSRAVPQRDAAGNILMWVGTSTNIQQIKEQDQQKDLFISMASHELKTPVTSIKGYVQILQSMYTGSSDKFLKNSLDIVDRQIVTLTKLISELLDLSKIKSGNLVLNQESFDLKELIKDKIDEIKHINAAKSFSFSKKGNPIVYADRDRIGQVLINFLTNAVKYSPDSVKVKVKAAVKDNSVVVSVEDSGIGINKADQEKIFERFYRVEGKNEKTFPGFGIGLFIASEIIKRHNGKIGVESEPGKGSIFYFSLPLSNIQ
jgi:PAS domain S-box-containing protein